MPADDGQATVPGLVVRSPVPLEGVDLLDVFAEFLRLDVAQGDASPETVRTYYGQVAQFAAWCDAVGIDPAHATADDLKAYRLSLVEAEYARATIAAKLNAVRRFYTMAEARGLRPDNPAAGLRAPKDHTARAEKVKWLPLAAIQRLLDAPNPHKPRGTRDRAILILMALHGLRVLEVVRLDVGDVDLEGMTAAVLGKGDRRRTLHLVPQSAAVLRAWLAVRDDWATEGETALFVRLRHGPNHPPGRRMSRRAVRHLVDGYLDALGLKRDGVSCHALRHSFATLSRAAGARLDAISRALGHSSVTTTQVYADIVDQAAENPALFLAGALEAAGE